MSCEDHSFESGNEHCNFFLAFSRSFSEGLNNTEIIARVTGIQRFCYGQYVHEVRAIGSRSSLSRFVDGQGFVVGVRQWRGQVIRNAKLLCSLPSIIVAEVLRVKPSVVVAEFSDHWR